ncbi:hypothetical protein K7395_00590 [Streptomyces filamentosus]|uniref:Phosphodiesterase n=2 Tax=Streptomyces filamentosus TaxID=67294 RepID=A0ABY4UTH4_STRFL|nr:MULTISPECIES: hypothetical protein [Streptomyces]EFE79435.1 conserved hypothetical protein [Streptomyces filamentosus NRRL 15998]ESU51342.1 hypothetical protein P376_0681 [Streptomyces sp. HCCB10043]MYR83255.1 hypothetical protein [Streptomyces sp. SID5466]USC45321.1 hypothetical protein K7395_00590 [Streptomyces filamentosus]
MTGERLRFDGWIAGVGTSSGTRLVVGHWPRSPFGAFSDVMIEHPDGERVLLAPSRRIADFVAATYRFDRIEVVPVSVTADAPAGDSAWLVEAGPLRLRLRTGRRTALGLLLSAVPAPFARSPLWAALCDVPARLLMPGVRTLGRAGPGRREWYGARGLRPVVAADAVLDGVSLGTLAPLDPPVAFGFGSAPRSPSLVRVTTTVELAPAGR